jgi:hypothetical protein
MMDNFEFKFVFDKQNAFEDAMKLAFLKFGKAKAWSVEDGALLFHWMITEQSEKEGAHPLPFNMDYAAASNFALQWWRQNKPTEGFPDIDGGFAEGFEIKSVYNPWRYQFVSIRPIWALYGK